MRDSTYFPEKLFFFQAKLAFSSGNGSFNSVVMPPTLLAAEKRSQICVILVPEETRSEQGSIAICTGREVTTLEIRDTLIPYIESLLVEHGNSVVNLVENFPNTPVKDKPAVSVCQHHSTPDSEKPKGVSNATAEKRQLHQFLNPFLLPLTQKKPKVVSNGLGEELGDLRPQFLYFLELGMDLEQIKVITLRYPDFDYCSLEGKNQTAISLSENLIPTMMFLEDLGVDKEQWAEVIYRFPGFLTHSRQKVQAIVDFLYESGLSSESIAQTVGCNIEGNLKPVTEFFLAKGYSLEQRIRPRYVLVEESGVKMLLTQMLPLSDCDFQKVLKVKILKMVTTT
ncbi:hypothetical protein Pint_26857 [Pistacia integerrima]|uniref:Uncharacterized protein n=1 Tax=Pistacia integerrima TaxID=434235 RepID=A0ACC0YTM1_9ROSI|nr:hypothetical protein Pint_26857 [Pistacia integerrima]